MNSPGSDPLAAPPEQAAEWLLEIGRAVRAQVISGRDLARDAEVTGQEGGDLIFHIDRRVEPLIVQALEALQPPWSALTVVCEGLGADGRRRFGLADQPSAWRAIIDPIDGTRSLMYDKRPAWFLAAIAPDRGEATSLADAIASVMLELPTSKQGYADEFWATRDGGAHGSRVNLFDGTRETLAFRASGESTLRQGFGQVSSFFPGTKRLAADLMETIAAATLGAVSVSEASIFDDQYISTGGQLIELAMGRDRFCCDLRPLFYRILEEQGLGEAAGLDCHPYDMAGLLVAQKAGVVITDGFGQALDAPFDVHTGVHWCGYANETLRRKIEPVIQAWLASHLAGDRQQG